MATLQHSIDTLAPPEQVWQLLADVAGWPRWNAGVAAIELRGPFADGSTFSMRLPDGATIVSTLRDVVENRGFADETRFDGHLVRVRHLLEPVAGGTRIVYVTEVEGPQAEEIAAMVGGDFGEVLAALKQLAEEAAARR